MEQLKQYLDLCLLTARRTHTDLYNVRAMENQAFGALTYHTTLHPEDYEACEALWDDYRFDFFQLEIGEATA